MAANAGSDDEQVVVERLGSASIAGQRGRYLVGPRRSCEANSVRVGLVERREPQGLSLETTESEIDRLGRSERESRLNDVV